MVGTAFPQAAAVFEPQHAKVGGQLDTSLSAGRSWFATWTGDPPDPPVLPPDQSLLMIDAIQPGDWMIRGFGTAPVVVEVPVLDGRGLFALTLLLAVVGWLLLLKRSG